MKRLHTLKESWLLAAVVAALALGEAIAWYLAGVLGVGFDPIAVGVATVVLLGMGVAWLYDGR